MSTATINSAISAAEQTLDLAAAVADQMLTAKQARMLDAATALFGIFAQSVRQQTDIAAVTMEQLNLEEVVILANDARAQADAEKREAAAGAG